MSRTTMLRFTPSTLAILLCGALVGGAGACAGSEEGDEIIVPKKIPDAAAYQDTSASETAVDSSVVDSAADAAKDAGSCPPLTTETKACGRCGTRTRTCSSFGTWNEWSLCKDEKSVTEAECTIDEVRATPCGNCGTQKDSCDSTTCTWNVGVCLGEGACAPGDEETSTASCPTVGEVRTRTCSDKCAWSAYSDCTLPKGWIDMATVPSGFDGRYWHTSVWTGSEMLVWGGYGTSICCTTYNIRGNGASYNLSSNAWKNIPAAPSNMSPGRWQHTAIWTGSKMLVWGGLGYYSESITYAKNDGAAYDPATETWSAIATPSLTPRYGHGAVWSTTTNEMLVWGGYNSSGVLVNDGAAYDPATNTWTAMAPSPLSPRRRHTMVWTGTELVIWGGLSTSSTSSAYLRDGARYDPKTKVWTKFPDPTPDFDARYDNAAVWSGKEMLVWGGIGTYVSSSYGKSDGARYLPGGSWTRFNVSSPDIFSTGTVATRTAIQSWFGGGKLWLWSGATVSSSYYAGGGPALAGGASYDPATDKWTTMDVTAAPTSRARATVVWTGKEAIIWGGSSYGTGSSFYSDGKIYRP